MKVRCPKCGSESINQLRQLTGPIWCNDCKFRVENKEIKNPFVICGRTGREGMNKNTIKDALDLQQKIISALRKALNKIEPEPIESTLIFGIVEQRYNNALIELEYTGEK